MVTCRLYSAINLLIASITVMAKPDKIDQYIDREMKRNHIAGLQVAIVRHGRIVKLKGYGWANIECRSPMKPQTLIQVASTTKTLTGAAIMLLVKQGKLSLDDSIRKYLPSLPAEYAPVKIVHLATHTSGVPETSGLDSYSSVSDAISEIAKLSLSHAPGQDSGYASADYILLAAVIEKVSGESYPDFLAHHVLQPLGMQRSGFDFAKELGPIRTSELLTDKSAIYRWDGTHQTAFSFLYPIYAYAAGGLYSSAEDMARWAISLDQNRFLDSKSKQAMWHPFKLPNGESTTWGIGWVCRTYEGRRAVGHSGGPALSDFLHFPDEGLTVIVLQNQQRQYPYLAQGIADQILLPKPSRAKVAVHEPDAFKVRQFGRFFRQLGNGKVDANDFASGHQDVIDDTKNLLVPFASSLPPLKEIRLTKVEKNGTGWDATFEASYGRKIVLWDVSLNQNSQISGLNLRTP